MMLRSILSDVLSPVLDSVIGTRLRRFYEKLTANQINLDGVPVRLDEENITLE